MILYKLLHLTFRWIIVNPPVFSILLFLRIISFHNWKELNQIVQQFQTSLFLGIGELIFALAACFLMALGLEYLATKTSFITTSKINDKINQLMDHAAIRLYIVSPYLNPGNVTLEALERAGRRGVDVRMIHHSDQLTKPFARAMLERLQAAGVKIHHHPNLHAKMYLNEDQVIVTSLNLVSGSITDSFEAGVRSTTTRMIQQVQHYIENEILSSGLSQPSKLEDTPQSQGYCIRTRRSVRYDPAKPVEYDEYKRTSGQTDGRYCHGCGVEAKTSVAHPFCPVCQGRGVGKDAQVNSSSRS
jgi:hypothetical protein